MNFIYTYFNIFTKYMENCKKLTLFIYYHENPTKLGLHKLCHMTKYNILVLEFDPDIKMILNALMYYM